MSAPVSPNPWDDGAALAPLPGETESATDSEFAGESVPDINALVPEESLTPEVSWAPTLGEVFPEAYGKLQELAAVIEGLGLPGSFVPQVLACALDMQYEDVVEILDTYVAYKLGNDVIHLEDPCQIRRMAKIGNCVARRGLGISFVPDLQDFWLDAMAGNSANLQRESFRFPPDERGTPVELDYYPMDTGWFFGRVGNEVEDWTVGAQQAFVWLGMRERLRAAADAPFPDAAVANNEGDISFLLDHVHVGGGPSTLHTSGVDWLYPKETWVRFKHALQGVNGSGQEIVDQELFMTGGMSITSEVEVSAEPAFLRIGEIDVQGWTARILSWRIRIADRIDYEAGETQALPVGTAVLELPDQLFLDLQANGCPGHPAPVDFDVISDAWHHMALSRLDWPEVFIALEPYSEGETNPFGGESSAYDFFDPTTSQALKILAP